MRQVCEHPIPIWAISLKRLNNTRHMYAISTVNQLCYAVEELVPGTSPVLHKSPELWRAQ